MRRCPKPGARTATASIVPCCLLGTSMPSALASAFSHRITSGRGLLRQRVEDRQQVVRVLERLVGHEDVAGSRRPSPSGAGRGPCTARASRSRRPCPRRSRRVMPGASDSSIVTTPSAPTCVSASATTPPMTSSSLAAIVATWTSSSPSTVRATRCSSATTAAVALLDAALEQHRVGALVERVHAFTHDRLREQRRRRRAVARQVGGLVGDLADELRAHVLVLVGELDLARDRHAVVGDRRRAGEPLEYDVAALRARASP